MSFLEVGVCRSDGSHSAMTLHHNEDNTSFFMTCECGGKTEVYNPGTGPLSETELTESLKFMEAHEECGRE